MGKCVGTCESVLGSPVGAAATATAQPGASGSVDWGRSLHEEFKISYPGSSLRRACTRPPRLVSVPSVPGRAAHPNAARTQGPETAELTGEGAVTSTTQGTTETVNGAEYD